MNKKKLIVILGLAAMVLGSSCERFLDEKSDRKLAVPTKLKDFQALLDDFPNVGSGVNEGEICADDYYLADGDVNGLNASDRGMYLWEGDIVHTDRLSSGWQSGYREIYYTNLVLDGLAKYRAKANERAGIDNIKGQALFYRGVSLFNMALVWCPAYSANDAGAALGLPLRASSDFNVPVVRADLKSTFETIMADLKEAAILLPQDVPSKYRPSKAAALGYLARISLYMGDIALARSYVEQCLALYDRLMDYNALDGNKNYPMPLTAANEEMIYYRGFPPQGRFSVSGMRIVKQLYDSYGEHDLRKLLFFKVNDGYVTFRGNYTGSSSFSSGVAVDEMYLIRAECYARGGQLDQALAVMNKLLKTRWRAVGGTSLFRPLEVSSKDELIQVVLDERRKQLLVRTLRWYDVKRLNALGAGVTLTRSFAGRVYELPPNSNRFALPIPADVIELSKIPQNPL